MKLFTKLILDKLLKNGRASAATKPNCPDHYPVVKIFTPDAQATWLLTEVDPENEDIAFGLCDLGMGFPELGSVSLAEITALRGKLGLPVERDNGFEATKPLSAYADAARLAGFIA